MVDLNERVRFGSDDALTTANDIDELGVATGVAVNAAGTQRAFLALPIPAFLGRDSGAARSARARLSDEARRGISCASSGSATSIWPTSRRRGDARGDLASVVGARSPAVC